MTKHLQLFTPLNPYVSLKSEMGNIRPGGCIRPSKSFSVTLQGIRGELNARPIIAG